VSPNATQTLSIVAGQGPAITSAASATFSVGISSSFTVTTSGSPAPSIGWSGTLPQGISLKDNGNGTATISGSPAEGTGGATC